MIRRYTRTYIQTLTRTYLCYCLHYLPFRYVDQGGGKRPGAFAIYIEPWHDDIFEVKSEIFPRQTDLSLITITPIFADSLPFFYSFSMLFVLLGF